MGTTFLLFMIVLALVALYYGIVLFREDYAPQAPHLPGINSRYGEATPIFTQDALRKDEFEKFLISRFPHKNFALIDGRSGDRIHDFRPHSNSEPEMMLEYTNAQVNLRIAVTCKWRSGYNKGYIEWAQNHQISDYFDFQEAEGVQVFVIIGIGGREGNPEEVFIIPLQRMKRGNSSLHIDFMKHYQRTDPQKAFYLDIEEMRLK